jgi:hypothetical protein
MLTVRKMIDYFWKYRKTQFLVSGINSAIRKKTYQI